MKEFEVFFEIYGKKMRTKIKAHTEAEARSEVRQSIKFHKVVPVNNGFGIDSKFFDDFFNNFKL